MADRITYDVTCCDGTLPILGRIHDDRATGGAVTWDAMAVPPPRENRPEWWKDKVEDTIRCPVCQKSAQLSVATTTALGDSKIHFVNVKEYTSVRVTEPDGHGRVIIELPLHMLCEFLRLQQG